MLSQKEVQHIAGLARITLSDEEIKKFQHDLGKVFDYFEILKEVDAENVHPMTHSVLLMNIKREDQFARWRTKTNHDGQYLIDMAPAKKNGYLKVKSIL